MKPLDDRKVKRLAEAMRFSNDRLRPFREHRFNAIREYVGRNYSDDGTMDRVPLNMLAMAIQIYSRQLAPNAPRVAVSTLHQKLSEESHGLELDINHLLKDMRFGDTLRRWVIDSLFGIGILKVGVTFHSQVELNGYLHDITQPYADIVHLDDWCFDMTSRRMDMTAFQANRYRLPIDELKKLGDVYNGKALKDLQPTVVTVSNLGGDPRPEQLSRGQYVEADEFHEMVDLWDIWLPLENRLMTIPADEAGELIPDQVLREIEWDGPENGPYHLLHYNEVPNNLMPLPPVALWRDIHTLANALFNKLARQAERQKDLVGFVGSAAEQAQRIKDASDGEMIRMEIANGIVPLSIGGVNPNGLSFTMMLKDMYSYVAGNLDLIGGLGTNSPTLGQDQLLGQSSSKVLDFMQQRVVEISGRVVRDLAWHEMYNPAVERVLQDTIAGTNYSVPMVISAADREGEYLDFNFEIDQYSMREQSPGQKLQQIQGVFQSFLMPFAAQMAQQGVTINFEELVKTVAKLSNLKELEGIISMSGIDESIDKEPRGTPPSQSHAPAQTTRTNVRMSGGPAQQPMGSPGPAQKAAMTGMGQQAGGGV